MDKNRLKMNTTKTEFMFVWFSQTTPEVHHILVDVVGDEVMWSRIIKYLGAILDEELDLKLRIEQKS